jgi:preprotein translocase subunit SecG
MNKQSEANPMAAKMKRTMLWLKFAMVVFPIALAGQIWILYQEYSLTNVFFVLITALALYSTISSYKKFKAYETATKDQQ